ncbi:isopentenyl-diphosphate delta-isomerase [Desulfotomaculum arcticum]|uniref:Isopentenyl-diphosphate delta-isomerase n=1 Tax=Desulfotruncus arcticus DSM 17038 TaxID=1121424 RepID=A0A1I2ZKS7_9FIRM|nr:isopentenyl-diphosphate delta-isomerase [Desulfotomaculum arcticum] [Desulfotruncus arcticus DSM 17038]
MWDSEDDASAGFEDISFIHNALPELRCDEIDCSCIFMGKKLRAPLMINAITGGHADVTEINRGLARVAAATGIAMAVGSQRAALDDPDVKQTFTVAREENHKGLLLANLNALCTLEEANQAVAMIDADGIQLHLNAGQELVMREGETNFIGIRDNIEHLVRNLPVPVLVKEVGFGLSREVVTALFKAGVRYIDVSGRGGTNFAAIEGRRGGVAGLHLKKWGIPTAISLLETTSTGLPLTVVASGGLRSSLDIALSLAAGAALTAIAGPFLKVLVEKGEDSLINLIKELIAGLEQVMMLTGAANLQALMGKPIILTGYTAEWLQRRGIDINLYACR